MEHVDEWTKEKFSYTMYIATLSSDFNNTNLSGVDVEFEGVVSLIEKEESSKFYTFKNINYSNLLANCSCDKCHKKISRNKYLVFSKVGKEVETRDDLVVLGTSCAKDYFPFSVESYFGYLESAFEELGSYDEFSGSFGGCSSHYHTLSAIYTATLATTDNLKCYEKEGVTKGNVLGWLNNLKINKYDYYRDVYVMPSNPIPFEDVISWIKDMLDKSTEELRSDFEINARSVFFKTLDDGTREMRHEIHEKYMGIAVYAMFSAKQNHDKMVAKKIAEEERAKANAEVTYFGNVGDKFEKEMTFEKMFGFETMYGYQYILLFRDEENHVFVWKTANGNLGNIKGPITSIKMTGSHMNNISVVYNSNNVEDHVNPTSNGSVATWTGNIAAPNTVSVHRGTNANGSSIEMWFKFTVITGIIPTPSGDDQPDD
jgi:hypothetical protein